MIRGALRSLLVLSLGGLFAASVAACSDGPSFAPAATPPPPKPPTAPTMSIELPDFPPLGARGQLSVRVTDEEARSRVTASFRRNVAKRTNMPADTLVFTGQELGEGMGTLSLVACDESVNGGGACRERLVSNLLVDLSPPEVDVERAVASPTAEGVAGQISFWVADAYVLGSVQLAFGGKVRDYEFPRAYPSTLGKQWDVSRVAFAARDFPEGEGTATLLVRDAAGNERSTDVPIRIDATPPVAIVEQPLAGSTVSGTFSVRVSASDANAHAQAPPLIEIWVGGTRIVELPGPVAEIAIDSASLPGGPTEVKAIARDEAGNASAISTVAVVVGP